MHVRSMFVGVLAAGALTAFVGCAGSMQDSDDRAPVGTAAELVAKKHEWLKSYNEDCQVCFKAFEQCQNGARSSRDEQACQIALNSCVRGGLQSGGGDDDGQVNADDGGAGGDDAGTPDDVASEDAGVINDDADDADAGASDPGDVDGEADAGVDDNKGELIEDIGQCLDQIRSCVNAANADKKACITELKSCVRDAIGKSFRDLCDREISQCVRDRVPQEALDSVRKQCEDSPAP